MQYNIVVATHHKTGTVWMSTVFKAIARGLGVRYIDFWSNFEDLDRRLAAPYFLFNNDSMFLKHESVLDRDDVRVLHLIRDPRDVLISAMHYHRVARESWLHECIPGYGNATYQQRLNAIAEPYDRYIFELDRASGSTIQHMLEWRYDRPNCFEARYEALRADSGMSLWASIVQFLGLTAGEQRFARHCFWNHSLFGRVPARNRRHVRSGAVAQWRTEFTPDMAQAFLQRFPNALQVLGYEGSDRWVDQLDERVIAVPRSQRRLSG
jgi:hypothetical protein